MYNYKAKITNVVDGDTFDFEIDLGFGITYASRLRLYGVDTPEVRGSEREEGLRVKAHVKQLIEGKQVGLTTRKWKGKYGRYIADVYPWGYGDEYDMWSLSRYLVEKGMARKVDY